MRHSFPPKQKLKTQNSNDIELNRTKELHESEPKLSDFSHLGETAQKEAKELLKVKVTSDFNNFDGFI